VVLRPEAIRERLRELDRVLEELSRYRDRSVEEIGESLSLRWTIERGLIAAANLIFDITDHILGSLGAYSETYEEGLRLLKEKGVISSGLYSQLKGFGGFRNVLVHEYMRVDIPLLRQNFLKALEVLPDFAREVEEWLEEAS